MFALWRMLAKRRKLIHLLRVRLELLKHRRKKQEWRTKRLQRCYQLWRVSKHTETFLIGRLLLQLFNLDGNGFLLRLQRVYGIFQKTGSFLFFPCKDKLQLTKRAVFIVHQRVSYQIQTFQHSSAKDFRSQKTLYRYFALQLRWCW